MSETYDTAELHGAFGPADPPDPKGRNKLDKTMRSGLGGGLSQESLFNGKPLLKLFRDADDTFGFTFGAKKAQLILDNLEAIKEFAGKYPTPARPDAPAHDAAVSEPTPGHDTVRER